MDKTKAELIADDIMKTIEALEKKHNIAIHKGSVGYSDTGLRFTIKVLENGVRKNTGFFPIDCVNMEFIGPDSVNYIVVEYKTRPTKTPVIIKDKKTNKLYRVSETYVKNAVKWVDKR